MLLFGCDDDQPVTITLRAPATMENHDIWFFVSNNQGEVIAVQKAGSSQNVVFKLPFDLINQGYMLHKFDYYRGVQYDNYYIETYTQVQPGDYSFSQTWLDRTPIGQYTLNVSGMDEDDYLVAGGRDIGSVGENLTGSDPRIFSAGVLQNNANMLCMVYNYNDESVARYKYIQSVNAGGQQTLHKDDLEEMNSKVISLDQSYSRVIYSLGGIKSDKDGGGQFPIGRSLQIERQNVSKITLRYPGDAFSDYITGLYCTIGGETWSDVTIGAIPPAFDKLNTSFRKPTFTNHKLIVQKTGDADFIQAILRKQSQDNEGYHLYRWGVRFPGNDETEIILPSLPAEILAQYPKASGMSDLPVWSVNATDYEGLTQYSDYLQFELQDTRRLYNDVHRRSYSISY
jgi:hypothetical protein